MLYLNTLTGANSGTSILFKNFIPSAQLVKPSLVITIGCFCEWDVCKLQKFLRFGQKNIILYRVDK